MYDYSYLSHKTRVNGFISIPYAPFSQSKNIKRTLKITNQIPFKTKTNMRGLHIIIKSADNEYTTTTLSEKLNASSSAISTAIRNNQSVTINGVDYKMTYIKSTVDVYPVR